MFEEEKSIFSDLHSRDWMAQASSNLGYILYEQGELTDAKKEFEYSLSFRRRQGKKASIADVVGILGELLRQEGQVKESRAALEEALALEYEIGRRSFVPYRRMALAQLSLQEGNVAEAEATIKEVTGGIPLEKAFADWRLRSLAVTAQVEIAQHKLKYARKTIEPILQSVSDLPSYGSRLFLTIAAGTVIAASGDPKLGQRHLNSALADASRLGYVGYQLEARLALAEIHLRSEVGSDRGRAELEKIKKDATAKGFNFIAHRAEALKTLKAGHL
jgi:tetratricopeptide (TPR) repeat protein